MRQFILKLSLIFLLFVSTALAVNLEGSGTQTAVISTEHTLFTTTTNKFYMGYIDLTNLSGGDTVELRLKVKIKGAGSVVQVRTETFSGAQVDPLWYFPPLPSDLEITITLKQTAGSGRNFDWRILSP